jgi:hypothetical protein
MLHIPDLFMDPRRQQAHAELCESILTRQHKPLQLSSIYIPIACSLFSQIQINLNHGRTEINCNSN